MDVKTKNLVYLFCFPLHLESKMRTASELKTFHLIWLKCCYDGGFTNVIVTKRDRERVNLTRLSYMRGLEDLEKIGLITVDRKTGRSCRISVNTKILDQKSKNSVLKGGAV